MQTISSMSPARAPRRIIAISIGLLSTLLLESCGGGGSTDPNATAQSVDDGTKTIQAVSGSTAVPGTWTGRAPKMEPRRFRQCLEVLPFRERRLVVCQ